MKCLSYVISFLIVGEFGFAKSDHLERIQGFYSHSKQQEEFTRERESGLNEYLNQKKKFDAEVELEREKYVEWKKKQVTSSVNSEKGPEYREYLTQKNQFQEEKEKSYDSFKREQAQNMKSDDPKRIAWFEHLELGLVGDLEKNRVDPNTRYKPKKAAGVDGAFGGSGGPSSSRPSGGGVRPRTGGYGSGDGFEDGGSIPPIIPPPPPPDEFDEGDSIPVPPMPND